MTLHMTLAAVVFAAVTMGIAPSEDSKGPIELVPLYLSAFSAFIAVLISGRLFARTTEDRLRTQAAHVYAYTEIAGRTATLLICNDSDQPVYDARVSPLIGGRIPFDHELDPQPVDVMPGTKHPVAWALAAEIDERRIDPRAHLAFTDAAGVRWTRNGGKLARDRRIADRWASARLLAGEGADRVLRPR